MRSTKPLPALAVLLAAALATPACTGEAAEASDAVETVEPQAEETRAPLELAGQYRAFLYETDRRDAAGGQLAEAWQVLREDRINYHDRNLRDADDEADPVFATAANRDRIETMVANGNLTEQSARKIVERNVLVQVNIYARDGEPERLDITVY